jgi:hypothetical protein
MAPTRTPENHPSEGRGETGLAALLYGLIAAPCAWIVAQIFCSGLASLACHPKYEPLATPAFAGTSLAHAMTLVLAGVVCASGAIVAYRAWRRTRGEHKGGSQTLLEVGEGRSRFMALAGVLTSVGFLVAVAFSIPAEILVPLC